jgi:ribosome-binding factor A
MAKYRSERTNEEIRRVVSDVIRNGLKDPRISTMVSVTRVEVTKDLSYAKVFVSIFGDELAKAETFKALKSSSGFIRREVAHNVKLRCTPEIIMEIDNSIDQGMHIEALLHQIKEKSHNDNE